MEKFNSAILLSTDTNSNSVGYEAYVKLSDELKDKVLSYMQEGHGTIFRPDVDDINQIEGAVIDVKTSGYLIQEMKIYVSLYDANGHDIGRIWSKSNEYNPDKTSVVAAMDNMCRNLLEQIESESAEKPELVTKDDLGYVTIGIPNDEEKQLFEAYKDTDSHMPRLMASIRSHMYGGSEGPLVKDIEYFYNYHGECFKEDRLKEPNVYKPISATEIVNELKKGYRPLIYKENVLKKLFQDEQSKGSDNKTHRKGDGGRDDR